MSRKELSGDLLSWSSEREILYELRCFGQKLVLAQDTGSAIVGAVRADYFAGTGLDAGALAATVNQPLRLWALWPK